MRLLGSSLEREVAMRFLFRGADPFTRFITWVSFVGLLLGVMVLTLVVSVMNGFDDELKHRLLSAVPHVVVEDTLEVPEGVEELHGVIAAFPFFEGMAMISRGRSVTPVSVFGLGAGGAAAVSQIRSHMRVGDITTLEHNDRQIFLGAPLAAHLGLVVGDSVGLVFAMPEGVGLAPVQQRFVLGGLFELDAELDTSVVLVALSALEPSVRQSTGEIGVQLRVDDPMAAPKIAEAVAVLAPGRNISTWMQRFGDLFQAVRMEKGMMFVILLLVVAVASFNIVSGQFMLVRKKTPAVAILRTMGANRRFVSRVFLLQGVVVGGFGILAGLLLGVIAAFNINHIVAVLEGWFGVRFLEGTFFVTIPVAVEHLDLAVIAGLSGALSLLAAYLPARRARRLSPIEGLHGA